MSDIEQRLRGENPEHCVVTDRLRANIGMPDTFQFNRDDAVELDELVLEAADELARLEADNASLRSRLEEAEGARDRERRRATDAAQADYASRIRSALVATPPAAMTCDEQFALATKLAGDLGYDLVPEPPHPDTPVDNFSGQTIPPAERSAEPEFETAPDNGTPHEVLSYLLDCAKRWVPEARIVGNARAGDIERALELTLTPPAERVVEALDGVTPLNDLALKVGLFMDNAGTASQNKTLVDDAETREAIELNIVAPLIVEVSIRDQHIASLRSKLEEAEGARGSALVATPPAGGDDWTVDDTLTAREILDYLGIGSDASLEPYADRRRDAVAKIIQKRVATTPPAEPVVEVAAQYAERLANVLWEKHYRNAAPNWKPLTGDLIGIITQIDNMTSGLALATKPAVKDDETMVEARDDLFTHRDAWRVALVEMRNTSEVSSPDIDDQAYWQHELDVFDRVFAALAAKDGRHG